MTNSIQKTSLGLELFLGRVMSHDIAFPSDWLITVEHWKVTWDRGDVNVYVDWAKAADPTPYQVGVEGGISYSSDNSTSVISRLMEWLL